MVNIVDNKYTYYLPLLYYYTTILLILLLYLGKYTYYLHRYNRLYLI